MKKIAILGSTGSIGTQTLEVVANNGDIQVTALAAGSNIVLLEQQIRKFQSWPACGTRKRLQIFGIRSGIWMCGLSPVWMDC